MLKGRLDRVKGGEVMKRKKCWSDCSKNHFDHVTDSCDSCVVTV